MNLQLTYVQLTFFYYPNFLLKIFSENKIKAKANLYIWILRRKSLVYVQIFINGDYVYNHLPIKS